MKRILFIALTFAALCGSLEARNVTGKVVSGSQKLSGVVVTDGTNFTQTKKNGTFAFEIKDDADFVYIITPSGYVAEWSAGSPAFYQKAEGKTEFVFDLLKTQSPDVYNIIAVGDPQPKAEEHFEEFAGVPLDDIAQTAAALEGMTIGIPLGDICYDRLHLQKRWKEEIVRAKVPFYPCIGNHDHDQKYKSEPEALMGYRENFGPENYAVFLGNDIMIVLDNIIYKGRSNYKEGYTDAILAWVKGLMAYVPADADIYVVQHSPLNGRNNKKMVIGHQEMLDILDGHKINFISGHNHTAGNFEYSETTREHNVAAICGTWWDTYHCTDGTPRGYKVFTKKDGAITWYYKSISRDKSFQFEVFKPGECRINKSSVVVNVWDYDPCWRVEWFEDGVYMGIMPQVYEYNPIHTRDLEAKYKPLGRTPSEYRHTRAAKHFFAIEPAEQTKECMIKVTDRFGNVMTETVVLK